MMVIFTSRSEKKSLYTVRRVLDSFANRIGNDTWQTTITQEGLDAVYVALRRIATKNTSVSCRWIRSRKHSELLWIVGNRDAFNEEGFVPVNSTAKELCHHEWENNWQYMPLLKVLVSLSSLLHDWGKTSDLFQKKLASNSLQPDPYRHEFVSCKLLEALVKKYSHTANEYGWLDALINSELDEKDLIKMLNSVECSSFGVLDQDVPYVVKLLQWLILSHHRLPTLNEDRIKSYYSSEKTIDEILIKLAASWGYENPNRDDFQQSSRLCFSFSRGILWNNEKTWQKKIKKWANRLKILLVEKSDILADDRAIRSILYYSRLCIMLADHYISSKSITNRPVYDGKKLFANTDAKGPKQKLADHLVDVSDQALKILHHLPMFFSHMEVSENVKELRKKSCGRFSWQDKVADEIGNVLRTDEHSKAFFVVNMASTGYGKTMANAKIIRSLSGNNTLRYILALGLRSLTLQTGDEYRKRIGLKNGELAVLIGSKAVQDLHSAKDNSADVSMKAENNQCLLEEDIVFFDDISPEQTSYMDIFFSNNTRNDGRKNRAFLLKPVLVSTIDHIIGATESIRGGHHILPGMRLMSSDLVIDEIDDFSTTDLMAISRLVNLAGMFGRNVIISSATIPPDLADGLYHTYINGLSCYNSFFSEPKKNIAVWCDEFRSVSSCISMKNIDSYMDKHKEFVKKRAKKLTMASGIRNGYVAELSLPGDNRVELLFAEFIQAIKKEAIKLHRQNHIVDSKTNKRVSLGLIRTANINPCIYTSLQLMQDGLGEGVKTLVMTYHSRQVLLLRHEQEKYLDKVLKRKNEDNKIVEIQDEILRRHIDDSVEDEIVFIVVATPVEEVGRDHDFDWAIVEPSSFRSIIQLAGRIRRHRVGQGSYPYKNIAVMQYNLRALHGETLAYRYPGFETEDKYKYEIHDIKALAGDYINSRKIDAIPRICKPELLNYNKDFVHLEHKVMEDFNDWSSTGPATMHGWDMEGWWLTGIPQTITRFRAGRPNRKLYAVLTDENEKPAFYEKMDGEYVLCEAFLGIKVTSLISPDMEKRLWLLQNYRELLEKWIIHYNTIQDSVEMSLEDISKRFGEISIDDKEGTEWLYDSQVGMVKRTGWEDGLWEL